MKKAAILVGVLLVFIPSFVFANPVPDETVFDLIQSKQNICVVFGNLSSWLKHRLTRTNETEDKTLFDEKVFESGSGIDGTDIFAWTDGCVPAGETIYTLEEQRDDGWHVTATDSIAVEDSDESCNDGETCDEWIDPKDYIDDDAQNDDDESDNDDASGDDDDSGGCS